MKSAEEFMKLILSILFISATASFSYGADQWCNGQYKTSMGTPYYPNGRTVMSMGTPYYPNGQTSRSMGTPYYPNGQSMRSMGTPYYPNGQTMRSMGTPYYPNGQAMRSMGTCYYENGKSMSSCPKSVRVKHTASGWRVKMDVFLEGDVAAQNLELDFPGTDQTTSLSVDFDDGTISNISAVCADTTDPGNEIIDLYMSSSAKDQAAAKQKICN